MIKHIFYICVLCVFFFFSNSLKAYNIPTEKNLSIINNLEKETWIEMKNENYIPYLSFNNIKFELFSNTKMNLQIQLPKNNDNKSTFYGELYRFDFEEEDSTSFNFVDILMFWTADAFTEANLDSNHEHGDLITLDRRNDDRYFNFSEHLKFKDIYYVKYNFGKDDYFCHLSRSSKRNKEFIIYLLITIDICSYKRINIEDIYYIHKSIITDNKQNIRTINNYIEQKKVEAELEADNKRKLEEKRKEEERQKKIEQKKKELEKQRKEDERKRVLEEERRKEAERKKLEKELEEKRKAEEREKIKILNENIVESKRLYENSIADQNLLTDSIEGLSKLLQSINSTKDNIELLEKLYLEYQDIYTLVKRVHKNFNNNINKVRSYHKINPNSELNLIMNKFKKLSKEFTNQKNEIDKINNSIIAEYKLIKQQIEDKRYQQELVNAFMQSSYAKLYIYFPSGVALLLLLMLIIYWRSSSKKIQKLNHKIDNLNNINNQSFETVKPQTKNKLDKIINDTNEKINDNEKDKNIKENINIEKQDTDNKKNLEKNINDNNNYIQLYFKSIGEINLLKNLTSQLNIIGLERFSPQKQHESIELEISQKVIEKSMFWLFKNPNTNLLYILPGRDIWLRSRNLLNDTSRFGYINLNGIFTLEEGKEFVINELPEVKLTDGRKYIVVKKGSMQFPRPT